MPDQDEQKSGDALLAQSKARSFGLTPDAIDDIFTYHSPTPDQIPKYEKIRSKARELGHVILENTPKSADQTAAIRLLREAVMTANSAVALEGKY